jgi:hypothetical protein
MAQINYRANLSSAIFPLTLDQANGSVIVPGPDNHYDRRVDPEGEQKGAGIPQAIYMENVIPTATGFQSVGWDTTIGLPGTAGGKLFDVVANRVGLSPSVQNPMLRMRMYFNSPSSLYCSPYETLSWQAVNFGGLTIYPTIWASSASVRGKSYVYIAGTGSALYHSYHDGTDLNLQVIPSVLPPVGGTSGTVRAISSNFNYLVYITTIGEFAWSSTTSPEDFVPSLVTGAGFTTLNNANNTYAIEPCPGGFYVFALEGAVYVEYTGNARYPWKFVPVADTSKIISYSRADVNSSGMVTLDAVGTLRIISGARSEVIAPEISAYLRQKASKYLYNFILDTFEPLAEDNSLQPSVYLFYDRYLCLSVEPVAGVYNTILIYDVALKRYGKLRRPHTHLAPVTTEEGEGDMRIIATNTATLNQAILDLDVTSAGDEHQSLLVLGRYKYVRSRHISLQEIKFAGALGAVECKVLPASATELFGPAQSPYPTQVNALTANYNCRVDAADVAIAIKGQFSVSDLELTFATGGGR